MSAIVPHRRPEPSTALILSGNPISSSDTWAELALLGNWLRGQGAQLVTSHCPETSVAAASTGTLHYYSSPRYPALERVWIYTVSTTTPGATVDFRAPATTGTWSASRTAGPVATPTTWEYVEVLGSQSAGTAELTCDIKATGGTILVHRVECWERSRGSLVTSGSDSGVDVVSCRPRAPLIDVTGASISAICDTYDAADVRRAAGLHWAVFEGDAVSTTSTSYVGLYPTALPLIGPQGQVGVTTHTWTWNVRCRYESGGGGTVRIVDGAGTELDVITIPGTSYAWGSEGTFTTSVDDLTEADGRPSGAWGTAGEIQVEFKSSTVGKSIQLVGISVWTSG